MTESANVRKHAVGSREKTRNTGVSDEEEDIVARMVRVINTAAKDGTMFKKMRENEEVIIYMSKDRQYVIKELPGGKILRRKAEDGSPWEPYDGPPHQGRPEIFLD